MDIQNTEDKNRKKVPITRNSLFFSDESFDFEERLAEDYMEVDTNQSVVLFEVDLEKTRTDSLYFDSPFKDIRWKAPKELPVLYDLNDPELRTYDKQQNLGVFVKVGKLDFDIMNITLKKFKCDIKKGDYIGIQVTPEKMEYFVVVDDGRVNFDNKHNMYGTRPYYRTVKCAWTDPNEFKAE